MIPCISKEYEGKGLRYLALSLRVPCGVVVRGALGWEEGAYIVVVQMIARRECGF